MQDDVKTLRERIDRAIQRITDGHGAMRVPADMTDPDTWFLACFVLDACRRHIDAEPARLAAAREEQREACAQFCEEEYYDVSHSECAFADSLEAIRATPLTATPLADELERAWNTTAKHVDERDAALARTKELKTALHFEREAHGRALREALDPVVRAKMMEPPPPLLLSPDVAALMSERDALKAQLAEAVGVLRALLREEWYTYEGNLEASGHASVDDLNAARAFLAKYPEGQ